ncbi:MAG: DUF6316 family protein [Pseudomonadota bacterium]
MTDVLPQNLDDFNQVREGEKYRVWYRGDRIFRMNGQWYFHTREGMDVGPFSCQFDAEMEAGLLINKLRQTPQERVCQVIRSHSIEGQGSPASLNSPAYTDYLVETGGIELLADVPMESRAR